MYKQTLAKKQPHTALAAVIIFAGVFVIYFIASFITFVGARLGVPYLEYAVYALLVALGYFVLRDWLTSYQYAISGTELLLEKYVGKRVRQREVIELSGIEAVESVESMRDFRSKDGDKPEGGTLLFCYRKQVNLAVTVRAEGARYLIFLGADEEMRERLLKFEGHS